MPDDRQAFFCYYILVLVCLVFAHAICNFAL